MAVRQFAGLLGARVPLVVTNFIVDESYTWIRYRLGHHQAVEFLRKIRDAEKQALLEVVTVTRSIEESAARILEKFSDQDLSYTDATSFALIEERTISRVFAFDRHYHLIAVEVIPGITR